MIRINVQKKTDHLAVNTMALSTGVIEASIAGVPALVTLVDIGVPTFHIDRLVAAEKTRYAIASATSAEAPLL